jgi:type IX secretion system substrate protein
MKHIILFLAILVFQTSSAQDPQLLENTWYLQNVIINGQNNFPPSNDELISVPAEFSQDGFFTSVCNELTGFIEYEINSFSFPQPLETTFIDCQFQVNEDFEVIYFNYYYSGPGNLYNYTITTDSNENKTLVVISNTGDQAIYGDHILSSQDFYSSQFAILPNPAKNELFLTSKYTSGTLTLKIFNLEGKLLSNQTLEVANQTSIDVSSLTSGIYFLNIEDENGNTTIKKFIKQ